MSCCRKHLLKNYLSRYEYPDLSRKDILVACHQFPDLRPSMEPFVFDDGTTQKLVQLEGTIPVPHKGQIYNIPVQLCLLETYPYEAPMVYVRPTNSMCIWPGQYVDGNGKVNMPWLRQWRWPDSDLMGLIQVLIVTFGEECPLFSKKVRHHQPQETHSNSGTSQTLEMLAASKETSTQTDEDVRILTSFEDTMKQKLWEVFSEIKAEDSALEACKMELSGDTVIQDIMLEAMYKYPDLASRDVSQALQHYRDLKPSVKPFFFNDGTRQQLCQLTGTIPVPYRGNTYNIPIQLWLLETYPHSSPMVFVKPTSNMQIKPGPYVDANGKVDVAFLKEWRWPTSNLKILIQLLIITFGEKCPVFSKMVSF